ncbi:MAG: formylglycine-generating enzyme family protein [Acetobacter malorum]|uniref:formylglycine-generating enzyme family protein n=1 Tax=Acetobacter malorum TaxID=178901 RepID=UPI0039E8AE18
MTQDIQTDTMSLIKGGSFTMGSEQFYPEERPRRRVSVSDFWIDKTPVTNRAFAAFVAATGYRTVAEVAPDPKDYPGMLPELAVPGSLVFQKTDRPVPLNDPMQWWAFVPGADWRHPWGPESSIEHIMDHPVVQVAYIDAVAYATWAGKVLPTEAEWEYAGRGGLQEAEYAWGDELAPKGQILANYWTGRFPFANQRPGGGYRTTEVGKYPPNGYGLSDMIGNVWEWTEDWYSLPEAQLRKSGKRSCCVVANPRGGTLRESLDREDGAVPVGRKVLKGGSHLCAANYCQRYRPAARHPQTIESATSHIGFRCIVRAAEGVVPD